MYVRPRLRVRPRNGGVFFSPLSLFADGSVGAWYDPSDYSTLFQDSAGTTPVTAVEQPVGLMLDKSRGLALGEEQVTNTGGPFTSTTGWTANQATLSVVGGKLRVTATAIGFASAWVPLTVPVGSSSVSINIVANNGTGPGAVSFLIYETSPSSGPVSGTFSLVSTPTNIVVLTTTDGTVYANILFLPSAIGQYIEISFASIKSLPGNHATQATSTSRPVLRARYNLLTYSEQFDNAAWTKSNTTVTANATTAPDGTLTADKIVATTNVAQTYQIGLLLISGASYVGVCRIKADTTNWVILNIYDTTALNKRVWFNLSTGAVGTQDAGITGSIVSAGNGWYVCAVTRAVSSASGGFSVEVADADGVVTAAVGKSIYSWGGDFRPGTSIAAYQRIAAATDYATAGFLPYLAFDGTDDGMATGSINFSAGDSMFLCAGLTKLSDAALGMVAELSANISLNNGAFWILAPLTTGASGDFDVAFKGTNQVQVNSGIKLAPITAVLSATDDISSNSAILRYNGAQVDTDSGVQGTGNFGNYPLYIGRRGGSSLPFNGRLYSLIVAAKAATATEITNTETWVNSKTGAF